MTTKITVDNIATAALDAITPPRITTIGYDGNDTATDIAGNVTVTLTGSGFATGATVYVDGASAGAVSVISSSQLTFLPPVKSAGTYPLSVINPDGSSAIAIPGISYSGLPTYTTAAGNLANVYETTAINSTIVATGDAPITYSVYSGTLPPGANLSSSGNITGTSSSTASPTTYNFTVRATDAQNQDTNRPFSITVNPDIVTWSSPAADAILSIDADAAMSNVTFSAASAAGYSVSYAANTLPTGLSLIGTNVFGTPTVTGNTISVVTATSATTNRTANRTFTWVVNVASDPYFKNTVLLLNGETTTPTWLDDVSTNNLLVTNKSDFRTNASVIPTGRSPYNKTTYPNAGSAWFAGEAPDGPGAYDTLSVQMPELGTVFTVEFWFYADETSPGLTSTKYFLYSNSGFNIGIYNDRGLAAGTSGFQFQTATGAFSVRTWNHVAVVRTGTGAGEFKMYLNGTLITLASGAFTSATTPLTTAEAKIGGQPNGYQNLFRGNIADFRMVNGTAVYTGNFTPPTAPLTAISGTVLLTFQNKQGTTNSGFVDDSTNGFPIIRYGNSAQGSFSPHSPTGWSNYFDGTGDYLTLPSSANLSPGSVFTFEAWIFLPIAAVAGATIYGAGGSGQMQIGYEGTGNWGVAARTTAWRFTSTTIPIVGQWNHIVVSRGGTGTNQTSLFLNGTRVANGTVSDAFNTTTSYQVGYDNGGGGASWTGYISSLRLVPGVDVYGYTNTTITVPTAPLTAVASTALLTCQNNRFIDNSTNNFTLTASGDVKTQAFSPFAPTVAYSAATHGGSMYFDGNDALDGKSTSVANMRMGTGDYTVEGWFYQSTLYSTYGTVFEIGAGTSGTGGIQFSVGNQSQGGVRIYAYNGTNGYVGGFITNPPLNTWNHIAWVRSSGVLKIYLNGVGNAGGAHTGDLTDSSTVTVGGEFSRNGSFTYHGYIADLRVVKGTAVYTSNNFALPTAPLTAISGTQLLLNGTNAGIFDRTGKNVLETVGYTTAEPGRRQPEINTQVKKYGDSSIFFGGTGDYCLVPYTPSYTFGTGDFTIEAWIYRTDTGVQRGIVDNAAGAGNRILFFITTNNKLNLFDGSSVWLSSTNTVTANQWVHVAVTRASGTTKLFINGAQEASSSDTRNYIQGSTGLYIGRQEGSTSSDFMGYIDDLRITRGVARYTTTFTPPTTFVLK